MAKLSNRAAVILGILVEKPLYGYEIEKLIEARGMRQWTDLKFSSIYYLLKTLEKDRFVTCTEEPILGKPLRKIYSITKLGLDTIQSKVQSLLSDYDKMVSPFDVGLIYQRILPVPKVREALEHYIQSIDTRITGLETIHDSMKNNRLPYFVIAVVSRPLMHLRAEREWVKQFILQLPTAAIEDNSQTENKNTYPPKKITKKKERVIK